MARDNCDPNKWYTSAATNASNESLQPIDAQKPQTLPKRWKKGSMFVIENVTEGGGGKLRLSKM